MAGDFCYTHTSFEQMNEADHNEQTIFEAARQLPAEQRAACLEKACGGDAALRGRMEARLAAPASTPASAAAPADEDDQL